MKKSDILIGHRKVGSNYPPFIIAEMSANHNQSLERAMELVEASAKSGAHAVKLQTYKADTMTLNIEDRDFVIDNSASPWKGYSLYRLYKDAHTPWEWHEKIFNRCRELGLIFFSTPFDDTAVDFLEKLEVPAYKIASFECTDLALIRKVANTGKPLIISTGMASVAEIDETIRTAKESGCSQLILLKCTSKYPASPENSNILTIPHMRQLFSVQVGLSDHTLGIGVAVASIAVGATVIEKHLTLSRLDGGVDSAFSMEPEEFVHLTVECKRAWQALGKITYGPTNTEIESLKFRRSLYIAENMKKGDVFTGNNLRAIRPGNGLPVKYYDIILGKRINRKVNKGTPMTWDLIG